MSKVGIIIVANKRFEADALVGVLCNFDARPSRIFQPKKTNQPPNTRIPNNVPLQSPRAIIDIAGKEMNPDDIVATVDVWCIEDMMSSESHKSSTEKKWPILKQEILSRRTDLVVAFGTAAYPSHMSYNGCVSIGLNTFIYNPHPDGENSQSIWSHERTGAIVQSSLNSEVFEQLSPQTIVKIEKRLLSTPMNPAKDLIVLHDSKLLSVGVVNITDYKDYSWVDHRTIEKVREIGFNGPIGSMETTHGIIHLASDYPFLYVSGIANRVGFFDAEVSPKSYARNFVASHNAAIAIAWLIPELVDSLQ